ncbi:MAG: Uncharacterised protein [Synechococcus sp. CC9902]|nr:MAG: Uncharacterised protein [Synechococcus sp. CC9902]
MHDLLFKQCPRHHPDHLAAQLQNGVSDNSHQSDLGCAINQADTMPDKGLTQNFSS